MRTIKCALDTYERRVKSEGQYAKFVRLPSSKEGIFFFGILGADGVYVPWPDNLTPEEMTLYIDKYGDIPDLFELKKETAHLHPGQQGIISPRDLNPKGFRIVDEDKDKPIA